MENQWWIIIGAIVVVLVGMAVWAVANGGLTGASKALSGLSNCGSGLITQGLTEGTTDSEGNTGYCIETREIGSIQRKYTEKLPKGAYLQYIGKDSWGCPPEEDLEKPDDEQRRFCFIIRPEGSKPLNPLKINTAKTE